MMYDISGLGLLADVPLDGIPVTRRVLHRPWHLLKRCIPPHPAARPFVFTPLTHRSFHVTWPHIGAFRIRLTSRRIEYDLKPGVPGDAFADVVVGPLLSSLLLLEGDTPLHGSALKIGGRAACFLGAPGAGKSTAAAACVLGGFGLITDDLLTIRERGATAHVFPGYPEIRLWPGMGRRLVPAFDTLPRVVPTASKRRLDPRRCAGGFVVHPVPLAIMYQLRRTGRVSRPTIEPLSRSEAFFTLVRNLYNTAFVTDDVLARQFAHLTALAARYPVRRLSVPRSGDPRRIPGVVLRDLNRTAS
jgi:hypothetical protein